MQRLFFDVERRQAALHAENRGHPSEGPRGRDALHDGRAAHAVEYRVHAGPTRLFQGGIGDAGLPVVEGYAGAEILQGLLVARARGGDEVGTRCVRDLDGERPDAPGPAVDEDGLPTLTASLLTSTS